jgi:hypothetical protein
VAEHPTAELSFCCCRRCGPRAAAWELPARAARDVRRHARPPPLPSLAGAKQLLQRMQEQGLRPSVRALDVLLRATEDGGLERFAPKLLEMRAEMVHHEAAAAGGARGGRR